MPTEMDYSRLASYIDCEGCMIIRVQKARKKKWAGSHYAYLNVCNTDRRMVDWCYNTFGGAITVYKSEHRPIYTWHTRGDVAALLRKCLPYFVIKAEQALVMLALRRTFDGTKKTLTPERMQQRETCRLFLSELKNKKRGYFTWEFPKEIEELFYWRPDEIPDVRNVAA
jgi:hypothetical protein